MAFLFTYLLEIAARLVVACTTVGLMLLLVFITASEILPHTPSQKQVDLALTLQHELTADEVRESELQTLIVRHFPYAESPDQVAFWVRSASEAMHIDPVLLISVIAQESSFRLKVKSHAGAIGLGQVIPKYWEASCGLKVDDPFNNVWCSAHALRVFIDTYKTIPKALAMYNVGATNYQQSNAYRKAGYRYANSVLSYRDKFNKTKKYIF